MMADRRGHSPRAPRESRKAPRHSEHEHHEHHDARRMRPAPTEYLSSSASSTSSMELVDISRTYPSSRSGIRSFFTAPSERRRLRRRRSSRLFKLNNSSSSSVNSDLAYGTGYIKRSKLRRVRSRTGKDIDRERYSDREGGRHRGSDREKHSRPQSRAKTEAEILAVGAGLAKLARDQNKLDLKSGRNGKRSDVVGVHETGYQNYGGSRGLAPSKISHGSDTFDEDGWESASDDGSDASVDSRLAFGEETKGGWGFWSKKTVRPLSRKDTVVDPRLFGPDNSLHGFVDRPVGFGEVSPWSSAGDFGQRDNSSVIGPNESFSGSQASLQRVYPVQGTDPTRFDAARSSVVSGSESFITARPDPVPLQHPQPYTPVSQNIYEPSYPALSEQKRTPSSSSRNHSIAQAAVVGVAGAAAIGAAAIAADRKDERREKRRDDDRDEDRVKRRDSDRKGSKDDRRRDKHDSPDRDERREKRREKERKTEDSRISEEQRKDRKREKRRDEIRDGDREERREKRREDRREERREDRREERRGDRSETTVRSDSWQNDNRPGYGAVASTMSSEAPMDQVPDRTQKVDISQGHRRVGSVPAVVTVEREPDFTRKRSLSIKERPSPSSSGYRDYSELDDSQNNAIYQETKHSTAPIAATAIAAAAVAATVATKSRSDKRRDERRSERGSEYDYEDPDYGPRGRQPAKERDPIQEEADRAYREIVMARKIASQVIRSRSASPDPSVVSRHTQPDEDDVPQIVTPPEMENHKQKGPYDAPNADFQPDYIIEHPGQLRTFSLPSIAVDRSNPGAGFSTRDPDTSKPRPFLNLVRPTPVPSPLPEIQAARSGSGQSESDYSESNRSDPARSSKSRGGRDEKTSSPASDVVIGPRGNVVSSPTSSAVSKGVTWGENVTKHYDAESPSDHRGEYILISDIQSLDSSPEIKPQSKSSGTAISKGWGAIAAGIIGGGAVAEAASSSETSKKSNDDEREQSQAEPYEHRSVGAKPNSPPSKSRRRRSPPFSDSESSNTLPSRVPGAFDDDLDFTATVAAGLQDTGFDPNIVIDDPTFRRRDSPPGTNEPELYRPAFTDPVSDLGNTSPPAGSSKGYTIEDPDSTPRDWRSVSPDLDETPTKLSKKEQKKRDKAAKRQSVDVIPSEVVPTSQEPEPESYFDAPKLSKKEQKKRDKEAKRLSLQSEEVTPLAEPSVAPEFVEEPESYTESFEKSKKKSKRDSAAFDDDAESVSSALRDERSISIPIDAFDDVRNEDDEWNESKKRKKKSKRDSDRYDSPTRSTASEISSGRERSFKTDPTEVSLPASTPSETSQDRDFEDSSKSRRSSSRHGADFDPNDFDDSRSAVSEATSRYDEPRKSKKKSRSSTRDDFDDARSVVSLSSAPAGDETPKKSKKKDKEKRSSGFFGMFGSKSESGAGDESPKASRDDPEEGKRKSKKSKRSSLPDDIGTESMSDISRSVSSGHSSRRYDDDQDDEAYGNTDRKKTRSRTESSSSKKDSFLGNAGTLGAGVGLAGAAVAIAAHSHRQSKAARAYDEAMLQGQSERSEESPETEEILDPDITQRDFRPSIDPQYGDLLPLPPSDPASPDPEPLGDLPELPESRPATPEEERLAKERARGTFRKNLQETPVKSPSHSAVPLKFLLGNRSTPSSPGLVRSSPMQSPATPNPESLTFPKNNRARPKSWDNGKEYRPLWLPESSLHGSASQANEPEDPLPALPPSKTTSRSSSQLDLEDLTHARNLEQSHSDQLDRSNEPLFIDTVLASSKSAAGLLDSEQSTPKANASYDNLEQHDLSSNESEYADALSLPANSPIQSSPPALRRKKEAPSDISTQVIAGAALVSAVGYLASSSSHQKAEGTDAEQLPSLQQQPVPADPVSKDRSSYLLRSSPMSRNNDVIESEQRDVDSPSRRKLPRTDADSLHHLKEEEEAEALEQDMDLPKSLEQDRERTLGILSGSAHDDISQQLAQDTGAGMAETETEPADEFVLKKSKKDKKKRKEASRSLTQDDVPSTEVISDSPREVTRQADAELEESFSLPKSKKDKKKDKKKSKSAISGDPDEDEKPPSQEEEATMEANPSVSEPTSAPFEDILISSKKGKKKDKKAKSKIAWEPESQVENALQLPEESLPGPSRETIVEVPASAEPETAVETPFPVSKKEKKKGKKGKVKIAWEPEPEPEGTMQDTEEPVPDLNRDAPDEQAHTESRIVDQVSSSKPEVDWESGDENALQEIAEPLPLDVTPSDGLDGFETKKGKKKNKRKSTAVLGSRQEEDAPGASSTDLQPASEEVPEGLSHADDDTAREIPKGRHDESLIATEEPSRAILEDESLVTEKEPLQDIDDQLLEETPSSVTEAGFQESKKTKKKKGKGAMKWDTMEEPVEALPPKEDADFESFVMPGFKKGKKKSKKFQSFTPDESLTLEPAETITEPPRLEETTVDVTEPYKTEEREVEEFVTTTSKKNKKKSKKSKVLDVDSEQLNPQTDPWEGDRSIEAGDPETTLATDVLDESAEPSSTKGSSTTAILSATAAAATGAALLAKGQQEKDLAPGEPEVTESLGADESGLAQSRTLTDLPKPDGLDAGYEEDQLSLAKQLQEEFGSKSKKLKKDKKKRQSLPATPDPESSRSRPTEEPADLHPRARSLSIGPATESDAPKNVYSEDQLELARQLKAEFGKGSKKSKKSKKARQESSEPAALDDAFPDQPVQESASKEVEATADDPKLDTVEDSVKGDGFAAGYQEDQLSLARQLQAEFGKKSKKDKKRRSTSQTPQAEEPQADYFGAQPQPMALDELSMEDPTELPESRTNDGEVSRDGLAAGYKEDQLELARQLKEEFGSGSKKSKKSKKGKKNEESSRAFADDDYLLGISTRESQEPVDPDVPQLQPKLAEENTTAPLVIEPEDEFTPTSKKSKKDKKGKKRQSLAITATDDDFSSQVPSTDIGEPIDNDALQPVLGKKSKKDKGKKRDIAHAVVDDNIYPETVAKPTNNSQDIDTFQAGTSDQPATVSRIEANESTFAHESLPEVESMPSKAEPISENAKDNDDFEFPVKKSKREKKSKKRQSLYSASDEVVTLDIPDNEAEGSRDVDVSQPDITQTSTEAAITENAADLEFTTKKSKKDKKSKKLDSLLATTAMEDIAPADSSKELDDSLDPSGHPESFPDRPEERASVPAGDEFTLPSKNSKKDKKKRKSVIAEENDASTSAEQQESSPTPITVTKELSTSDTPAVGLSMEEASEAPDDFTPTSKKSKKEKKERKSRKSLLSASTPDSLLAEPVEGQDLQPSEDQTINTEEDATIHQPKESEGEFQTPSKKKSKKDKKKRQSMQEEDLALDKDSEDLDKPSVTQTEGGDNDEPQRALPEAELTMEASPILDTIAHDQTTGEVAIPNQSSTETPDEALEDALAPLPFTKKTKSDKKKRKDSLKPTSDPAVFTPSDSPDKPEDELTKLSLSAESTSRDVTAAIESRQFSSALDAEGTGVWDAFTTKKSKKDKKKRKDIASDSAGPSEIPTPLDFAQEPSTNITEPSPQPATLPDTDAAAPSEELTMQTPDATQDTAEELVLDDWASPSSKKSSKGKKKRKSGISTPIESLPEASVLSEEPVDLEVPSSSVVPKDTEELSTTQDSSIPTTTQDFTQDPTVDEWGFSSKKSKKDKKKRKSGFSTPAESIPDEAKVIEAPVNVDEPATTIIIKDIVEEPAQVEDSPAADTPEQVKDPGDDEWTIPLKQSKKDKKKRKSGLSTPIESAPEETKRGQEPDNVIEPSTAIIATHLVEEPVQVEDPSTSETQKPIQKIGDDEWAVTTKKSKKSKRISGLATPIETASEHLKDPGVPAKLEELPAAIATEKALEDPAEIASLAAPSIEQTPQSAGDDDWAAIPSKKSKKDKKKRKSGLSTPIEMPQEPTPVEELTEQVVPATIPQDAIAAPLESNLPTMGEVAQEPVEDDWAAIPSKNSEKDKKKRRSGISSPAEENLLDKSIPMEDSSKYQTPATASQDKITELPIIDESTIAATTQEVLQTADTVETPTPRQPLDEMEAPSSSMPVVEEQIDAKESLLSEQIPSVATGIAVGSLGGASSTPDSVEITATDPFQLEEPEDEWASYSTKKSKKDKKKDKKRGKSGSSTPAGDILEKRAFVEEPSNIPFAFEPKADITAEDDKDTIAGTPVKDYEDEGIEPATAKETTLPANLDSVSQDPEGEWAPTPSKKSRKDKKQRKSGVSTPTKEEALTIAPDLQKTETEDPEKLFSEPLSIKDREPVISEVSPEDEENTREATNDGFEFSTKKSKKDKKKGRRASRADSVDQAGETIATGSLAAALGTNINIGSPVYPEREAAGIMEEEGQNTLPKDKNMEVEDKPIGPVAEAAKSDNVEPIASDIVRKGSKKDKRKRQATIDQATTGDAPVAKAPLTTWAYEVEEAEVERELPVIKDIAKDGSLSHIASTTEARPTDDFIRPTKKGKKGTKRNSALLESAHIEDSPRALAREGTPATKSQQDSKIHALATAGAALVGAGLLSMPDDAHTTPKTQDHDASRTVEPVKEPEPPTPTRKLSKKEKRKMSIDRRTPKDDMFDDPALWEGADPKEFEETKDTQDDSGGDGFWSAPSEEHKPDDLEITPQEPDRSIESLVYSREEPPTRTSTPPEPRAILPQPPIELSPSRSHYTTNEPPSVNSLQRTLPPISQHISSPSSFDNQDTSEKDIVFEDAPVERNLFRTSKFGRSGFSDLPAVAEENPIEIEAGHYPASHSRDAHEPSRDSGFITESPIPRQGAFTTDHEHVRDSGVHLRDSSPSSGANTLISAADAAMASLSWPHIDEDKETVDLHKLQRSKTKDPDKRAQHGKSERRSYESPRPEGDQVADFFRVERSQEAKPVKQHHDEISFDSIHPRGTTQEKHSDLHRTSKSDRSSENKPHRHREEGAASRDFLPSQQANVERHTDLHRSQTIHRSTDDRHGSYHDAKITSRDITPPQRSKGDRITNIHRSDTGRGSPKPTEDSLVKKRLQRFESPEVHQTAKPREENAVRQRVQRIQSPSLHEPSRPKEDKYGDLNRSQTPKAERPAAFNDNTIAGAAALAGAATLGFAAARQLSQEKRPSSGQSQRSFSPNINRLRTPDPNGSRSSTPSLRRSDRKISGDLRSLSQRSHVDLAKEAELAAQNSARETPSTTTPANPTANEGRVRTKDMADVYDGFGEGRMGSPRSPTRPHSMRRRQSMQVLDLESKVEQLATENRMLAEAKAQAERTLQSSQHAPSSLVEKDAEIDSLKLSLEWLQNEVTRLTEVNDGLTSANVTLGHQQNERYGMLESQHAQATRELGEVRDAHNTLSTGMDGIILAKVQASSQEKDQEIAELRAELESAKEKIRNMQRQILISKTNDVDFLTVRDEDYFDNSCQQLCQHVQQWVLRFSKFSDMRACRLTSEINNDKTIDRLDNAILDGSDVDDYLTDRVKRRDVFMSMTMTMVWEFIFTRYLFGMDREQRQKLKSLEKLLSEVGPPAAVHHWRATTLTLLSRRDAFIQQREQDTQAVVHAVLETLSEILPPPSHLEAQIEEQLKRVMTAAVDLSIEMRTQRAEYMMLPPLQPEYDANGDLASKVSFNSALMNERSGDTTSNKELEDQKAVVRVVLFPLVVKKGDDRGEGDEEIVVCPAQVLVAKPKKSVRVFSPEDMAHQNTSRISMQSSMPADYGERDSSVI